MQERLVAPGAPLAFSEEYLPGKGTYDDGTQIRAALWGRPKVDPETMDLTVEPAGKGVATVEPGDIVVGEVTYLKSDAFASVKLMAVRGKEGRSLLLPVDATLHVSKVDKRYIADMGKEYHTGDVIRAKVLNLKGGPQLATDADDLGCIRAFSVEGHPLEREGDHLIDPETGRKEFRKLARDYGSGTV